MYGAMVSSALDETSNFSIAFKDSEAPSLGAKHVLLSNAAQEHHFLSNRSLHASFSKQFIPVVVLAVFLLLFFASHLLRYPRILYIAPRVRGSHFREGMANSEHGKGTSTKMVVTRPMSAWRISSSRPKESKASLQSPRPMPATYSEPTVRLVKSYNNRSPEPRVYLPEEITLPHYSPTLVGSSSSEFSVSNADVHVVPPRVYLSPTLPDAFDYGSYEPAQQKGGETMQDIHISASTGIRIVENTSADRTLSPPPGLAFTGLYNPISTSSDVHIFPPVDLHTSFATLVSDAHEMDSGMLHVPFSPELSPPPQALAHPILVRRALSPWRRRSPIEGPHDVVPAKAAVNVAEPGKQHRPSVPSRLRYFITRSASVSQSSSHTRSLPESSLGKRSEKSLIESKPSAGDKIDCASSKSRTGSHGDDDSDVPQDRNFSPMLFEPTSWVHSSSAHRNATILDTEVPIQDAHLLPEIPGEDMCSEDGQPSFWEPPSPSETEDESAESEAPSANNPEDQVEQGIREQGRASIRLSATETHRSSTGSRALFGLGLRVASDPMPMHPASRPPSFFRLSTTSEMLRTVEEAAAEGTQDSGNNDSQTSTGPNLRTMLTRWMTRRPGTLQGVIKEGDISFEAGPESNIADESVEIMFMNRWAGLESV